MKNNSKQQNFAGKILWLLIFVTAFFVNTASAVTVDNCSTLPFEDCSFGIDNTGNKCVWDNEVGVCFGSNMVQECSQKETWAGCFLKKGCVWYNDGKGAKCKPRSSKHLAEATWTEVDCRLVYTAHAFKDTDEYGQEVWVGGYVDYDDQNSEHDKTYLQTEETKYKYFKNLPNYVVNDEETHTFETTQDKKFAASEACLYVVNQGGSVCDYSHWLNDKGKRKCREYLKLKEKALNEKCLEEVENVWQRSLKTNEDRLNRREGIAWCKEQASNLSYSFINEEYSGPIFDGPGLRGGAQMAQMKLSNSISKQRDIKKLIISWAKFALEIAAVLAVLALIYAGFRYITDMGDGGGIEAAKKIIIWTIVGILLILSSYAIVNTVIKARFGADDSRPEIIITSFVNKIKI